jgi:hypothetical protein
MPGGFQSGQTKSTGSKATPNFIDSDDNPIPMPSLRRDTEIVTNAKGQKFDDNYGK